MASTLANSTDAPTIQRLIRHQLRLQAAQPDLARHLPPLMLWGPPGVGKSSLVRAVCAEEEVDFIDIRLAQREPIDLRGLPVPREDRVDWLLAGEWPRDPASRGIILFDELTAADRSLQVAAYELILDRRLGDLYTLPPGWLVMGAGNRTTDRAVAQAMSSALANRFCHLELEPDVEQWCRWAAARSLHPDVIAFVRFRPESFFDMAGDLQMGWPSPRSWERVAHYLTHAGNLDGADLALMVQGLVGAGAGSEFLAFREWSSALPDVPTMLARQAPISIPERADQKFALCSALVYHLWQGPAASLALRMDRFFEILLELTSDFASMALLDAMAAEGDRLASERATALFDHPLFAQWSERHGAVFAQQLAVREQAA